MHVAGHDHGEPGHARPDAIELIVHGHRHDPGTPDHQHSLTVSTPLLETAKRPADRTLIAGSWLADVAASMSPAWYRCAPGVFGPSPPSEPHTSSILRI